MIIFLLKQLMYKDIIQLLDQKRLKEAFAQLGSLASETNNWTLTSEVETLQNTYGYMLQYAAQGTEDPQQGKMYAHLYRKGYELADRAEFIRQQSASKGFFATKCRTFKQTAVHSFQEIGMTLETNAEDLSVTPLMLAENADKNSELKKLYKQKEKATDELFDKIWTSAHWTDEEAKEASALLDSQLIPANSLAVMVSAATLSLLQLFDPQKLQFLLLAYRRRTEAVVSQRALAGILLTAYYQEKRLSLYPELTAALTMLGDNAQTVQQLHDIQILFLLSRETEKIGKRMREQIIPKMMRNPRLRKTDFKIIDIEDLEDKNPEWEKEMQQISDEIQQLGELQMEGADTYMSTFSQLKSYAFFGQAAHWFYPFDKQTADIADLFADNDISDKSLLKMLLESPIFCNSDKYSFCLTLFSLPKLQIDALKSQIGSQSEVMEENLDKLAGETSSRDKANIISRQYIHDLYRFFKLWMYKSEQHDIFADELAFWKSPFLNRLILQNERRKQIADYLFAKDYFPEASELYEELVQSNPEEAGSWQKLGFSYQKMERYEDAINAYLQADIVKPDHIWTLKHLAQCYKRTHNFEKALEYFYRVESIQPDNLNLLLQIGQCLATLRNYDKALQYFFKVEYLDRTPANAQRAIGWCYFMTGKHAEALRFFEKLIQASDAQISDWLNTGHVYLAMHQIPKALECYRHAEKQAKTHDDFMKIYLADKDALLEQGVTEESVYLIPDLLL